MPIIVACPQCTGQLRVADDLIGRKVRCPACNTIFEAIESAPRPASPPPPPTPSPAPSLDLPVETQKIDPWRNLDLELAPDSPAAPPPPRGAVEIDRETTDPPARPPAPPRPGERRARLNDDHDDLRPCPACRRMVHRDARRCFSCGERIGGDDDDVDPRDRRRPVRRDCEPHRGGFILTMGILSLASWFVCPLLAPIALIPGLIAWIMGQGDLRKMRAGAMDPAGQGNTQAGWICGIIGTCICAVLVLGCGGFIGVNMYNDVQRSKRIIRPPQVVPAPQPKF